MKKNFWRSLIPQKLRAGFQPGTQKTANERYDLSRFDEQDIILENETQIQEFLPDILGQALARTWIDRRFLEAFYEQPNNKNPRIKDIFTRVLKGHIAVSNFKFKKDTCGAHIDKVARKSLNEVNLDYAHGTGHGVGYYLNVHEGPQAISKNNKIHLQRGMILSNEPGYYEKGKFGIRIENLIFINKDKRKIFFENLTLAPIDKSLIDKKKLTFEEIKWLNNYHKKVFLKLKKFMNKPNLINLKQACSKI